MSIEVRSSLDRDAGVVIGDAAELHHVVMNVCTNAYQAIDDAVGTLCVELQAADLDADAAARLNVEPGPYVHVRVTDTGKGMDEETKARAFDPFFTTKPVGAGVGMGLSTVYGIVTKLGGTVVLASAPGHGTSVDLYLPRACESELAVPDAGLGTTAGGERILVVDDEARVLEMLRQMMEQLGYRVTAVNSAVEALDVFRRQPDVFDVVITDQTMPAMTGVELARALREIRSDLPIVIATGHAISGMNAKATGLSGYVSKPYLVQDLSRAVQEALRPHPAVGV
jgi:CheY-like chemotaxis protein/anti-sigma regulatory factor (Ser/Thr protein kinase)